MFYTPKDNGKTGGLYERRKKWRVKGEELKDPSQTDHSEVPSFQIVTD